MLEFVELNSNKLNTLNNKENQGTQGTDMLEVAILKNFDSGTYKAAVQLVGSLTTYFDGISVAKNIPTSAMVVGNFVIIAIPGANPKDACVIASWPGGTPGGGMEVHGNEYHDPDFEQAGTAATLVETHRTSQTHTQPQPPAEHGNEKHSPDFATEAALASHAALTNPHSATPNATPSRLILRDASGRAQVAAPSASDDIARKQEVDAKPSTFLQLSDTPSSYSGQAGKYAKVNAGANALEFGLVSTKIQDADGDTSWDVEPTADADEVVGKVKAVEAFRLHDNGILTLAKQPAARAYKQAASQTIPNVTDTKVILEVEDYDIQGEYNPTTYRFTAKKAGLYIVLAQVFYMPVVNQKEYESHIYKNGARFKGFAVVAVGTSYAIISNIALVFLAANDYIESYTYQNSGSSAVCSNAGIQNNFMAIAKIA